MEQIKCLHFYNCYFIANDELNEYWMLDIPNTKLRPIDEECYNIIEALNGIKEELKNI